ncbi:MAG: amidohydrolase [Eubacteriales bacterium]|nr:amidohydrolase [Eubacteriales bacterium]
MTAIINANIMAADGSFEQGHIVFDDKILSINGPIPDNCDIIDAKGGYLTPGLIDAHCHLGMVGDSQGAESDDGNEDSEPIMPHLRAIDAINPFDRGFDEARRAGVTCVVTGPGSANPIGGQFAAIKTSGICVDDMIVKAPCAIKIALGENPKMIYSDKDEAPLTRMGTMALIREALYKARDYSNSLIAASEDGDKVDFDIKNDALLPLIRKEIPAKVHAHRADDICSALRLAKEFDINVTIEHCTDGEVIADILSAKNVPVMLGPTLTDRSKPELKSLGFPIYKTLSEKGVSVAIITDHPEITIGNLRLMAQLAVKNGMSREKALLAITSNSANNCCINDRVGLIKEGLDADFALFDSPPLDFMSENVLTIINGKTVYTK